MASAMQDMVNYDSDSWLTIARLGSSGHIKLPDKPSSRWDWGGESSRQMSGPETTQQVSEEEHHPAFE